ATTVQHEYYVVGGRDRYDALKRLADANPGIFSVVFCRTKRDTQRVAEKLIEDGYNAGALHGDLSQNQRDMVMNSFRKKQVQMLVATDVAARGIDVDDITHVINYQLPDEIETYTHRSGRTGRAGKSGISMVIITRSELRKIRTIENIVKQAYVAKKIPPGMEDCEIELYYLANKIKETELNTDIDSYLPAINNVLEGIDREELIKKMVSVEFTQFFNYYSRSRDLNSTEREIAGDHGGKKGQGAPSNNGSVRYFINIGERDGYDWMNLKDFLRDTLSLEKEDVYNVDTKDSFSFFNTDAQFTDLILQTFTEFKVDGRFINVEVSKNPENSQGKGGGRKRDGKKRGHRKGGDHKGDHKSFKGGKKGGFGNKGGKRRAGFY